MTKEEFDAKISGLKPKYQEQFKKIYESNENFKGDFNIMAFLFGIIWTLSKSLWLISIVGLVVAFFSAGIGAVALWVYLGVRGTYLYYKYVVHNKQEVF
jgi:hypothetical protein